jgi:hypothetical protein
LIANGAPYDANRKQDEVINESEKYRASAARCRKAAKAFGNPMEWLAYAASWDALAAQAEQLSAREFYLESVRPLSAGPLPTRH